MKYTELSVRPMGHVYSEQDMLVLVGQIAGECYNSSKENDACVRRALGCIKRGHHSPWEHVQVTLNCTVDRGTSHALVRHRHCAFQQSSTIYQRFDDITLIASYVGVDKNDTIRHYAYEKIEQAYKSLLDIGEQPSSARDVLPNALATNLIITTNIRQWFYMMKRRIGPGDSERMHLWASCVRAWFEEHYPQITAAFDNWYEGHPL